MPAHIDVRVGKWQSAADQNVAAIAADRRYRQIVPKQGFYHLYMAHNHHFLAWASMMEGRNEAALKAAREMVAGVPPEFIESDGPVVDTVAGITFEVLMRFGRWDDVLAEPEPPAALPITRALWRFARGIAYAAKGQVEDALAERKRFQEAVALVPEGAMMATNPASNVLAIADHMLAGEILFRRGRIDEAAFEAGGEGLRDPLERARLITPLGGLDGALDGDAVMKTGSRARRVADHDRRVVTHGEQTDRLVPRGLAAEEVGEDPLAAGVLVGDEGQRAAAAQHVVELRRRAFLVQQVQTGDLARAQQEVVQQRVVERAHDGVQRQPEPGDRVAQQFEVAEMGRDQDRRPPLKQAAQRRPQVAQLHVA
jgi:hypothetical protein